MVKYRPSSQVTSQVVPEIWAAVTEAGSKASDVQLHTTCGVVVDSGAVKCELTFTHEHYSMKRRCRFPG